MRRALDAETDEVIAPKHNKARTVPMSPRVAAALASLPRHGPIHALRHTFGTVMARRVPLGVLQRLMGHTEVTTTMRYVDVNEDDKRDAITAVFGAPGQPVGNSAQEPGRRRQAPSRSEW